MSDFPKIPHEEVWKVLHEECGAREKMDEGFPHHWPCPEYRFSGALGFGGKVRDGSQWLVTCYAEDYTPEREAMIERANARLLALQTETYGATA